MLCLALLGTAFFVLGRRADAHDAVQEAFFKCWRRRDRIEEVRNVEGWVTTAVLNQARDIKRRSKRQQLLEEVTVTTTDTPHAEAERQETLRRVRQAIYRLPEPEREAFLDEHCGADEELRRRVEAFLRHEMQMTASFLDPLAQGPGFEAIGEAIGHYNAAAEPATAMFHLTC